MKLIVIDGLDGSGKATQTELLRQALENQGIAVRKVSFPNYESPSSALVKMYLGGEFAQDAEEVNAYAASSFYAVDRYASYKMDWGKDYAAGTVILCDRYATSNLIHQMTKLPKEAWEGFVTWHADFEYDKLGLPRPNQVIYLDMDPDVSQKLMLARYAGNTSKKDIHEKDVAYLKHCRETALFAARHEGWKVIECSEGGQPLSIEAIHRQLLPIVKEELETV